MEEWVALRARIRLKMASVSVLAAVLIASMAGSTTSSGSQGSDAALRSSMVMILQGENDQAPGSEDRDDFYGLKIMSFDLPYDEARVFTTVPTGAHDIVVWYGANTFGESQYGWETSGPHAGDFFIDVPTSHTRTQNYSIAAGTLADFTAPGSQLTNLNYTSGALRVVDESSSGTYISPSIPIPSAVSISSLRLTISGDSTGNITSHVSTDGGTTWWSALNDTLLNVTSGGTALQVMFELSANATLGYNTSISSFVLAAVYVPATTVFSVHVSYLWTAEFSDGSAGLDLSEPLPFSLNGSYVIMLYTMPGYIPAATGFELVLDESGAMNPYDDKDLYLSTTSPISAPLYTVRIAVPETSSNLVIYSVIILVGLALAGVYAFGYHRRRDGGPDLKSETAPEPAGAPKTVEIEVRRKELVERKKEMLAEIEDTRSRLSAGSIDQAVAAKELSRLKGEFKSVRNELNHLSRKAGEPPETSATSPDYDSVIASLARIDDDFERGRLPEGTYKTLRKEYVQKAAGIMAAQSAASKKSGSPVEDEKNRLMEAIVALDDEHDRGAIDEKVYLDLRASYRKQLAGIMKRSAESGTEE